jgi:hypothetical protein
MRVGNRGPAVETADGFAASAMSMASAWSANPVLRRTLAIALAVAIAGAISITVAATWKRLPEFEWRLNVAWLAVAAAGFTTLHLTHAALWNRLLGWLDHRVEPRRARAIWCTSGLARYTPGSLLMPMVRVAMTRSEGVSKRTCLASVIYELALMLTGAVVIGAYAVVQTPELALGSARYLVLAIPLVALASLHPRIFRPLADVALRRIGRDSLPTALPFSTLLLSVVLYAATWVLAGLSLYALLEGLHPVAPDDFLIVVAAPAVGYIAAALAFMLPGGLGAREAGLAAVLNTALPLAVAVAIAVALRLLQLTVELACAAITPLLARSRPR